MVSRSLAVAILVWRVNKSEGNASDYGKDIKNEGGL